jgi:hypothetical protein
MKLTMTIVDRVVERAASCGLLWAAKHDRIVELN